MYVRGNWTPRRRKKDSTVVKTPILSLFRLLKIRMIETLIDKYFFGVIGQDDAVHGLVVEEVGRDRMFLLVRYLDWDTHEEFTYVRVVLRSGGWQFFATKEALIGWLNNKRIK
jgi:hypothetical protein